MKEITLGDVLERLDEVLRELRRQGRASVAAQAAAESCLVAVQALVKGQVNVEREPDAVATRWLQTLLPVFDAIDRVTYHAVRLGRRHSRPKRWLMGVLVPGDDGSFVILLEGLHVLNQQIETALMDLGVLVDRSIGLPVNPMRHRVVELRAASDQERPGIVAEVVRPGYAIGVRIIREAEVVATDAKSSM